MTRYADPERCPDCQAPIHHGATSCPACELTLVGPVAARLFRTLAQADELLAVLRDVRPAGVPLVSGSAPAAAPEPRPRGRLSQASVPKILLGLGAVCLLVAALVFLAVTWSVMGVAGRTATLLLFTAVTGALSAWMARRDLRAAAESLTVVALGLLAFDLFGARDSGWFGAIGTADFLVLLGVVLAAAGGFAALAVRRTPVGALTGAELIVALGAGSVCVGLVQGDRLVTSAALTVAVLVSAGMAVAAHRSRLLVLAAGAAAVSGLMWLMLLSTSWERAVLNPTARELWLDLEVWPLAASAVLIGAPALVRSLSASVRVAAAAVVQLITAAIVLVPFGQDSGTVFTLAVLALMLAAFGLAWFTPAPWSPAAAITVTVGAGWMALAGFMLTLNALVRLGEAASMQWAGTPGGRLPEPFDGPLEAWLLPVTAVALVGALVVLARAVPAVDRAVAPLADLTVVLAVLGMAGVGTVAMYPVPVWLVTGLLASAALAFTAWAMIGRNEGALLAGAGFLAGGFTVGLYDRWLTALVLLVVLAAAGAMVAVWPQRVVCTVAGAVVAGALAGSTWAWGAIAGAEVPWTALVALLVLAVLAIASGASRWTVGFEIGAAGSAMAVAVAGVDGASYELAATWTAVYLTTAGVAVSAMSLLRADRRMLGWLGGGLLAAATWVRLGDLGVEVAEAYTLPSAVALGVVGLLHLRANPMASTMKALAPGLGLALLPSLLWVLWEPGTIRSVLLGVACLVLLAGGLRMRWTAPVVFGATVGACVVLRHAAPYVGDALPRWVLFAAAGSLLISMGVTWERRIQEARAFVGYVRALR